MSITKQHIVQHLLGQAIHLPPAQQTATAFAHANIALCKYWGKRDTQLNLPVTSSLSISLGTLGSHVTLRMRPDGHRIRLNGQTLPPEHVAHQRITTFLELFRPQVGLLGTPSSHMQPTEHALNDPANIQNPTTVNLSSQEDPLGNQLRTQCQRAQHFDVRLSNTIPTAAGFASSASMFAALVKALNTLFAWQLPTDKLCILARLGSGSACRSLQQGFVLWHAGKRSDGMDSIAEGLSTTWPDLRLGLLVTSSKPKAISSRQAMQHTLDTSPLYACWPQVVQRDLACLRQAIAQQDFHTLGQVSQANALAMHATMLAARPSVLYWLPDSVKQMHTVWQARKQGLPLYFTMDAGANLKLLFLQQDEQAVCRLFEQLHVVAPFT